jgi:uncharacterized membrane protein
LAGFRISKSLIDSGYGTPIYFDAILEPNRPLSPRGLLLVIGSVGVISFVAGILFALHGAWPVSAVLRIGCPAFGMGHARQRACEPQARTPRPYK